MTAPDHGALADVVLRDWREDDLPLLQSLRNDVELQAELLSTARGSDMSAVRGWLERRGTSNDRLFRVIARSGGDLAVGYMQAEALSDRPGTWCFGICVAPGAQGAGVGTAALMALERLLVSEHGAQVLTLEVAAHNTRAIRCYTRLGYRWSEAAGRQISVCDSTVEARGMIKTVVPDRPSP